MNHRIGFAISTLFHLSLVGAVVVSWPDTPAVEKEKALPFNLRMLQSKPLVQPEVTQVAEPASALPSEPAPAEEIVKPIKQPVEKVDRKQKVFEKTVNKLEPKAIQKKPVKKKIVKKKPQTKPLEKPVKKHIAKKQDSPKSEPVVKSAPLILPVLPTPIKEAPLAIDGARLLTIEDEFRQSLMRAITKNQFYPKRAKRRHHEGVVRIAFTILKDGMLDAVRINKSSGYKSLDRAALKTVAGLERFKPIPEALNRQQWDFVVPLRYELL